MAPQAMIGPVPVAQATYPTALSALFSNLPLSVDFAIREDEIFVTILLSLASFRGCLPFPGKKDFDFMSRHSGRCAEWCFFG